MKVAHVEESTGIGGEDATILNPEDLVRPIAVTFAMMGKDPVEVIAKFDKDKIYFILFSNFIAKNSK